MASAAPPAHPFVRPDRPLAVPLIPPGALRDALRGEAPPRLLDVRPTAERAAARLDPSIAIPLSELPARSRELGVAGPLVVVDQFGSRARQAVRLLLDRGRTDVAALEGGLDEYARLVDPTMPRYRPGLTDGTLLLQQLPRPDTGCLAYLVADPAAGEAIVLDPGHEPTPYLAVLRDRGWRLRAIVETHTHADHLAGHAALHAATDAPIVVSRRSPAAYPHASLADGDALEFGGERIDVLETPGHTRDHLSLRIRDKVFTGDTLLLGSCGRTDLGDGDPDLLWSSLTEKLLPLPDETEVFPAHFGVHHALPDRYVSSIGFERATNEALLQSTPEAFHRYMTEGWPPKPASFDRIVAANLAPL